MKFQIFEPPEGAPKGAGDLDIKQVRNHFKPNNFKRKMPNINPIVSISPPLSVDRSTFDLKTTVPLTGFPHVKLNFLLPNAHFREPYENSAA